MFLFELLLFVIYFLSNKEIFLFRYNMIFVTRGHFFYKKKQLLLIRVFDIMMKSDLIYVRLFI